MAPRLSNPIESLIGKSRPEPEVAKTNPQANIPEVDVAIVGSGYGASIAATRLASRDRKVVVLERGREYLAGDFPVDLGDVPGHVRFHRADSDEFVGYADALFDLRIGKTMDVLVGNGLGGTSLINANVAVRPDDEDFRHPDWPHEIRTNPAALNDGFRRASLLLRVDDRPRPKTNKYRALRRLARALRARCKPAPLTVAFTASEGNAGGSAQPACTMCGNCVTGCNVGAKTTLTITALQVAEAAGAKLYTGATVLSVMPSGRPHHPWIVRFRRTASEKTALRDEVFQLAARDVILAAGTLGSTEILKRSQELGSLAFSKELGEHFSGNGDTFAFGFGQKHSVHAIGEPIQQPGRFTVGPTITGIVRKRVRDQRGNSFKLTIEDAAVPTSISALFGELVTTGAFLHRLGNPKLPTWFRRAKDVDPVAAAPGAIEHSQMLLMMGDDEAAGILDLQRPKSQSADHARLIVNWDSVGTNRALLAAHAVLKKHDRRRGFGGGQYVPNPMWRLLPEGASTVMSGPAPGGRAITVHPLGGCRMGDSIRTGVVNHRGQVFRPVNNGNGTEVYDGLHVMDGAIVPKALGLNPLLTISALAWRAAELLRDDRRWPSPLDMRLGLVEEVRRPLMVRMVARAERLVARFRRPTPVAPAAIPPRKAIHIVLREQLIGTVNAVPGWLEELHPRTTRWARDKGLILRVDTEIPDLDGWLGNGTREPRHANAMLYAHPLDAAVTEREHRLHITDEDLTKAPVIAAGNGTVAILEPEDAGWWTRLWRTVLALRAYSERRQTFRSYWAARRTRGGRFSLRGLWNEALGFWHVAQQHARYRRYRYRLDFRTVDNKSFTLIGEKRLAWRPGAPRLWDAVLNLPFTLSADSASGVPVTGKVEMDMTYVVTTGAPQVKASPHLPATVVGLAKLGMLFGRALLQTHFWDFGAPQYPKALIPRPVKAPSLRVNSRTVEPERIEFEVPLSADDNTQIPLVLTRYRQPHDARPVLLIHGLAQGSLIYATDTLDTNMASAMWQAGYDVWLLDYRLSNMLPHPVPQGGWYMDELAQYDIPIAVEQVYERCGHQPVSIFAHCVGATSVAMAILTGRLKATGAVDDNVRCVAFNAIHPWTMPSSVNEFRARFGSVFRDVLGRDDMLDPVPAPNPSVMQVLFDRLAFSIARYAEEPADRHDPDAPGHAATVCDRMTFLYGRMWRRANLDPRTHEALPTLVGPGAGDVYRQLYYFALHERLTDHDGLNVYLTEQNIRTNWGIPTFFLHGEESMVFNPQSAERSAIRLDAIMNYGRAQRIPVRLLRVSDFGHMDVVFAKDAHTRVYPALANFFDAPKAPGTQLDPSHDLDPRSGFRLTAGPVIRAAWIDDQQRLQIRLWAETNDEVTSLVQGVRLVGQGLDGVPVQWTVDGCEDRYRMVDARLAKAGPVEFNVGLKIGPGSGKTMAITDEAKAPDDYAFALETLPWLKRLREAAGRGPCSDMRFLVGSCRYPGTAFEAEKSDAIFNGMLSHIRGTVDGLGGVHMLFFVGDQIYADATANIVDNRAWRERYAQRYRVAFTSQNAREVLAKIPTHFAIDDHEIADNWSGEQIKELAQAVCSARSFQSSGREHRPIDPSAVKRPGDALWYSLSETREHCCPAFVMDTRSERHARGYNAPGTPFVSASQLGALTAWLDDVKKEPWSNMPKFIFCGVGIAPISRAFAACGKTWRSQDWWPGYPGDLSQVLFKIVHEQIRHVVFVSGDLHLSSVSKLTLRHKVATDPVSVWQVVSSGLYAPMPFASADPASYDWNCAVRLPADAECEVDVIAESGLLCAGQSHFLRIDAEAAQEGRWTLSIGAVGPAPDGAFLQPVGGPPRGAVLGNDGRWHIDLA